MNKNYFEVFKNDKDHYNWSKQKEYAAIADGISENTKKDLLKALITLEKVLGKDFLKSSHHNNPVRQMIIEKTEFQIYQLIEFAETLKVLEFSDINFSELQKKLLPRDKSKQEGVPFVEIAQTYIQEQFKVSFPVENNIDKSPDIKIINPANNDIFFIEVSTINENEERIKIRENYNFFHENFHCKPLQNSFLGKQKKIINKSEYQEISEIIAQAKKRVEEQEQIIYYSDNRFNFLLVPKKYKNELDKIVEKESSQLNNIDGLPLNFNLTNQIISKIKKEANQIPLKFNGLIYFPVSPLFFVTTDIDDIITPIVAYLTNFKNIIGIVIYSKIVDNNDEIVINIDKHIFRRKSIKNLSCESLFINNNNFELYISNKTLEKIYKTF